MPASSHSMLFTWGVESVLISLVGSLFLRDYLVIAHLAMSMLSLPLHILCAALKIDKHYVISVSYLNCTSGCLIVSFMRPLDNIGPILSASLCVVFELMALGMTFASVDEAVSLFFEMRGHFAWAVPLLMETAHCLDFLNYRDFGFAVAMIYIIIQLAPFDLLTLTATAIIDFLLVIFFAVGRKAPVAIFFSVKLLVTSTWLLRMFLQISFPDFLKVSAEQNNAISVSINKIKGPWIETIIFTVLIVALLCVIIIQENYIVIFPVVLCILWVVFLWVFQEARSESQASDVAPSAPPHSALPTHSVLIGTKKMLPWPRMRTSTSVKDV
jgi:hypothetical protein